MRRKWSVNVLLTLIFSLTLVITMVSGAAAASDEDPVAEGVYVESVALGGMNREEAQAAIDNYASQIAGGKLILTTGEENVEIPYSDFGVGAAYETLMDEIMAVGQSGNIVERYKELADVKNNTKVFDLSFEYDKAALTTILEAKTEEINREPQNAYLTRENGELMVVSAINGRSMNITATLEAIDAAMADGWDRGDISIAMTLEETEADVLDDALAVVKDKLGTYTTSYASSDSGRAGNIHAGADKIGGVTLQPGEEFSFNALVEPFTPENGYYLGGAYSGGKLIQSYGGGICQVSSTLYNAVLRAELEIVYRTNHSMTVGYVPLAADATIASPTIDFKFKNNQDAPVYIDAYADGVNLTITIYGQETRPENRTLEFISVTEQTISPGADVVTEDGSKNVGYEEVTASARTGYVASLYKNIYIDGEFDSQEFLNRSTYQATPRYVTKGTKEEPKKEEPKKEEEKKEEETQPETPDTTPETPDTTPETPDDSGADGGDE